MWDGALERMLGSADAALACVVLALAFGLQLLQPEFPFRALLPSLQYLVCRVGSCEVGLGNSEACSN